MLLSLVSVMKTHFQSPKLNWIEVRRVRLLITKLKLTRRSGINILDNRIGNFTIFQVQITTFDYIPSCFINFCIALWKYRKLGLLKSPNS